MSISIFCSFTFSLHHIYLISLVTCCFVDVVDVHQTQYELLIKSFYILVFFYGGKTGATHARLHVTDNHIMITSLFTDLRIIHMFISHVSIFKFVYLCFYSARCSVMILTMLVWRSPSSSDVPVRGFVFLFLCSMKAV